MHLLTRDPTPKNPIRGIMSPETFLTLMFLYFIFQTVAILFFIGNTNTSSEEMDRRNMADDVHRMRTMQDIKYYRDMFRGGDGK